MATNPAPAASEFCAHGVPACALCVFCVAGDEPGSKGAERVRAAAECGDAATIAAYLAPGSEMTANECLAALGMTKRKRGHAFDYFDASGKRVLRGSVFVFNDWLRAGRPGPESSWHEAWS